MNHEISIDKAVAMTTLYKQHKQKIKHQDFPGKTILPTSETFDRTVFDKILKQKGCSKLRIYFSMKDDLSVRLIIVGVDENDADMLPTAESTAPNVLSTTTETTTDEGDDGNGRVIAEEGISCPPVCPITVSPLNP